jgi:hypothetical protein
MTDRVFWLVAFSAGLSLLVGRFVFPDDLALRAVVKGGYWGMFGLGVVWVWATCRAVSEALRVEVTLWRRFAGPGLGVLAVGLLWQAHEEHGFKVLADELLLLGTSQSMHLDRDVGYALRTTDVQGHFQILQAVLDKRPLFFPFLGSLVHDLTGYRPQNLFWLNSLISFCFLGLLFQLGCFAAGARYGGWIVLILAAGSPILAQQASGGGFELLNATLLTLWWIWMIVYLRESTPLSQDALVLTAIALASTRYESLLALAPTVIALIWVWWRRGAVLQSAFLGVAPVLLLPTLWLNQAFSANTELWELHSREATRPFGLEFVPKNLGHALAYFFSVDGFQPNSLVLSVLGFLALPVALLWAIRQGRACLAMGGSPPSGDAGLLLGALAPLAVTGLLMIYFWGQFDDPVIRRLSLPTQLLMLVAIAVVTGRMLPDWRAKVPVIVGFTIVGLMAWSLPIMAKNAYGRDYSPAVAHEWRFGLVRSGVVPKGALVIDADSLFWATNRFSATPVAQAALRREGIAFHLRNHSFEGVFVVQNLSADPATGDLVLSPSDDLGGDYELELVTQEKTQLLNFIRLSRVVAIRDEAGTWSHSREFIPVEPTPATFNEKTREGAKEAYLENWIRQLP